MDLLGIYSKYSTMVVTLFLLLLPHAFLDAHVYTFMDEELTGFYDCFKIL